MLNSKTNKLLNPLNNFLFFKVMGAINRTPSRRVDEKILNAPARLKHGVAMWINKFVMA